MEKEYIFETPEKPEIEEGFEVEPDTQSFNEPEKAEALMRNLDLKIGDTIRENEGYYTINPRMVLKGETPDDYKKAIDNFKKLLTKEEIKTIGQAISRKTKSYNKNLYDKIKKKFDAFYWRGNIKKSLSDEIKTTLEIFKEQKFNGIYNTLYHLLSKGNEDYIECYRCAWKNQPIPNTQRWSEEIDGEYRVMTDSEADISANDYLTDDDELWKQAVQSGNTTSSLQDWADQVLNIDGRASLLNGYDGCEEYEDINDTTYYIYRNN